MKRRGEKKPEMVLHFNGCKFFYLQKNHYFWI
jgi:hypothetical protein